MSIVVGVDAQLFEPVDEGVAARMLAQHQLVATECPMSSGFMIS